MRPWSSRLDRFRRPAATLQLRAAETAVLPRVAGSLSAAAPSAPSADRPDRLSPARKQLSTKILREATINSSSHGLNFGPKEVEWLGLGAVQGNVWAHPYKRVIFVLYTYLPLRNLTLLYGTLKRLITYTAL